MISHESHSGWCWLEPWNFWWLSIQLGMSSSQLTSSMIFQGGRWLNHQPDDIPVHLIKNQHEWDFSGGRYTSIPPTSSNLIKEDHQIRGCARLRLAMPLLPPRQLCLVLEMAALSAVPQERLVGGWVPKVVPNTWEIPEKWPWIWFILLGSS